MENPDRAALAALYEATNGPNWINNDGWLTDAPLGEWFGVETDSSGRVVVLAMSYWDEGTQRWISNNVSGPIPPEIGDLTNLRSLWLPGNGLSGSIPSELGDLVSLRSLNLWGNDLAGPLPQSFLQLGQLEEFSFARNGLCLPGTSAFAEWLSGVEDHDVRQDSQCNAADVAVLKSLYDETGGPGWTESGGWLGDGAVDDWHGVDSDSLGHVTTLDLSNNALSGRVPASVGELTRLTELRINGNSLTGQLPLGLSALSLREFNYAGTDVCTPGRLRFVEWLESIETHEGTGVECESFTLSGTVTDSRRAGLAVEGATVRLENETVDSVVTDSLGRFQFSHPSGEFTVTVSAEPSYREQTAEITMNGDHTVDFSLEHTGETPFYGTVYFTPDLLVPSDPTSLGTITYAGRGMREIYDKRVDSWINVNAYLFNVQFGERTAEFQLNPEFGSIEAARAEVDVYAASIGRLPAVLLSNLKEVEVNAGLGRFGGNGYNGSFLIHTEYASSFVDDGFLEEVLIHEGGHMSLDLDHFDSPGWRAAQEADGVFISEYAREFPDREDIAESISAYVAVRLFPDRLTPLDRWTILTTIPNRLAYFDEQEFDLSPYTIEVDTGGQ